MHLKKFDTPSETPGQFFDRLTIVCRKAGKLPKEEDRKVYLHKYEDMIGVLPNGMDTTISLLVAQLMMVNTDIWNLEAELRQGKEGKLGEAEVGRRAIYIREHNANRIALVNSINKLYGITEKEVKTDHASQEG